MAATTAVAPETETAETGTALPEFDAAPDEGFIAIRRAAAIDPAYADRIYAVASTAKNGAVSQTVFPSADDKEFKSTARRMKAALMSRLDPEKARAAVVIVQATDGVKVGVQIKVKRAPKASK